MNYYPSPLSFGAAPIAVSTRQWQARKMRATQFGDNKTRPSKMSRTLLYDKIKLFHQAMALMGTNAGTQPIELLSKE